MVDVSAGHVTIDAPARQLLTMRGKETTTLHGVARQPSPREWHDIALLAVDIVASGAGHLRGAEALAPFQQRYLVAMHVDLPGFRSRPPVSPPLEGLPRHVGERRGA